MGEHAGMRMNEDKDMANKMISALATALLTGLMALLLAGCAYSILMIVCGGSLAEIWEPAMGCAIGTGLANGLFAAFDGHD